jgi:hypothetical protein
MKYELNLDAVASKKTIVGGIQGEQPVKLVGFTVGPDINGNPNYKFVLELLNYPGEVHRYNCGDAFYPRTISNIAQQLGYEAGKQPGDNVILKEATKKEFKIWIVEGTTYFYDRIKYLADKDAKANEEVEF